MKPRIAAWGLCLWGFGWGVVDLVAGRHEASWTGVVTSTLIGVLAVLALLILESRIPRHNGGGERIRFHITWYGVTSALFVFAMIFGWRWQASFALGGFYLVLATACMIWEHSHGRLLTWVDFRLE
jgi:hypothetical protein